MEPVLRLPFVPGSPRVAAFDACARKLREATTPRGCRRASVAIRAAHHAGELLDADARFLLWWAAVVREVLESEAQR